MSFFISRITLAELVTSSQLAVHDVTDRKVTSSNITRHVTLIEKTCSLIILAPTTNLYLKKLIPNSPPFILPPENKAEN